jgi:hypothetical protein
VTWRRSAWRERVVGAKEARASGSALTRVSAPQLVSPNPGAGRGEPPTLNEQSGSEKCGQSARRRGKMRGATALADASQP